MRQALGTKLRCFPNGDSMATLTTTKRRFLFWKRTTKEAYRFPTDRSIDTINRVRRVYDGAEADYGLSAAVLAKTRWALDDEAAAKAIREAERAEA